MTTEEELARLRAEVERLVRELAKARQELAEARQVIAALEKRIAELEHDSTDEPPRFVKPNRPKREGPKQPRKKRASHHNHARRRESASRVVEHADDRCPKCNYQLQGKSLDYSRQVIDLPEPQPVEVVEYRVIKRYCPHCQSYQSPKLDLI